MSHALQVMRKKTDPETLVLKKKISKSSKSSNIKVRQTKRPPTNTDPRTEPASPIQKVDRSVGYAREDTCDEECIEVRERSVTPVQSDLLKYLNVHITPPEIGNLTSFKLSREEYLDGIIKLVQSDCPEVVSDMGSFMEAMQNAFKYNMEKK